MADQVCICTHFGDDHHPDAEDSRCKVIGCDCAEFREQPGPTRTMGVTMSVETAIGLEIEAALVDRDLSGLAGRIMKNVVEPVVAELEAENARLAEKVRNSIPIAAGPESPGVSINSSAPINMGWMSLPQDIQDAATAAAVEPPSPVPRVWEKGDPAADDWFAARAEAARSDPGYEERHRNCATAAGICIEEHDPPIDPYLIQDGSYPDGGADA